MTQENKELLLKDLCARWTYGVTVLEDIDKEFDGGCVAELVTITEIKGEKMFLTKNSLTPVTIEEIHPYLRPMSSMTEAEKEEFEQIRYNVEAKLFNAFSKGGFTLAFHEIDDWLNAHHFDYRGLIPMELALEAPEGMYK